MATKYFTIREWPANWTHRPSQVKVRASFAPVDTEVWIQSGGSTCALQVPMADRYSPRILTALPTCAKPLGASNEHPAAPPVTPTIAGVVAVVLPVPYQGLAAQRPAD